MKGDFHVRFCERLKLKCFGLLDPTSPNIGSKYLSLSKAGLWLRAEGILIPHLHKALTLAAILANTLNIITTFQNDRNTLRRN